MLSSDSEKNREIDFCVVEEEGVKRRKNENQTNLRFISELECRTVASATEMCWIERE